MLLCLFLWLNASVKGQRSSIRGPDVVSCRENVKNVTFLCVAVKSWKDGQLTSVLSRWKQWSRAKSKSKQILFSCSFFSVKRQILAIYRRSLAVISCLIAPVTNGCIELKSGPMSPDIVKSNKSPVAPRLDKIRVWNEFKSSIKRYYCACSLLWKISYWHWNWPS